MAKQTSKTFGDDMSKAINILSDGTQIKGNISSQGDIRIDGNMVGNLSAKGKVVIGDNGKIEGQVEAANVEVAGLIKGKVMVSELLNMKGSARIEGDIVARKLAVEPGAIFTGSCSMGEIKKGNEAATKK